MAENGNQRSQYFWKISLSDFTKAIRTSVPEKNKKEKDKTRKEEDKGRSAANELKQLNVLAYILQNVHERDNTFVLTYDDVADRTGVSKDTVVRIMNKLGWGNFIRKLHNGVYMVNPYMLMWGPEDKRKTLYATYIEAKAVGGGRRKSKKPEPLDDSQSSGDDALGGAGIPSPPDGDGAD